LAGTDTPIAGRPRFQAAVAVATRAIGGVLAAADTVLAGAVQQTGVVPFARCAVRDDGPRLTAPGHAIAAGRAGVARIADGPVRCRCALADAVLTRPLDAAAVRARFPVPARLGAADTAVANSQRAVVA
jgi:hypothetical protein